MKIERSNVEKKLMYVFSELKDTSTIQEYCLELERK